MIYYVRLPISIHPIITSIYTNTNTDTGIGPSLVVFASQVEFAYIHSMANPVYAMQSLTLRIGK